jgi:DNA polymerase I-like protein with 3'-5' exonuclease and polymerase domains
MSSAPLNQHLESSSQLHINSVGGGADSPLGPVLVIDSPHRSGELFSGWQWDTLRGKLLRAGFAPESIPIHTLNQARGLTFTNNLIIGMGEQTLAHFTGKRGLDKWTLSPLTTFDGQKFIGTYDMTRVQKQYELNLYQEMAFCRAKEETTTRTYERAPERFLLNPSVEETLAVLRNIKNEPQISVDVETGYGQINTVGFAWSASDAIAINVLPDRCGDSSYYELWRAIAEVMEGPSRKVFQNFIYDTSYFSAYGIRTSNIYFDTMWAMKVLYPELKSNLGNVGRFYTKRPYWKDDGKVTDEESGKRDWGAIRDWPKHYFYNCRDTTGTHEAAGNQREDLTRRGLLEFYDSYLIKLTRPIQEMCANGMPVSGEVRDRLKGEVEAEIARLTLQFNEEVGRELNPRSSKQMITYLKEKGVKVPKVYDKKKEVYRESVDSKSIKKIRLKYPELKELATLQDVKSYDTMMSRYINFEMRPDGRLSYSLNGFGTETGRFSGGTDPWDRGFNIQTIPREGADISIKQMFVAPEGYSFIEADLSQAETRYVAYDSACKKLIDMLESGEDIHKYVAYSTLKGLGLPSTDYSKLWRDLGKKTGHGANYMMKSGTFIENVFNDMDKVLTKKEGDIILESYFHEFPEIRERHSNIRRELYNKRRLKAPTGWERYFYGRPDENTLREAVAWAPQHTIPYITNKMLLHLCDERAQGKLKFHLLVQVHDALYLLCKDEWLEDVAEECLAINKWQTGFDLAGGKLLIPCEVEICKTLATKEKYITKRTA